VTATATCTTRFPRWIDSLLVRALPARRWAKLRDHLRGCDACRERYNRVSLAERMLHGGPAALDRPSPTAIDRIGEAVLLGSIPSGGGIARVPRWVFGLVAATCAAVALVPLALKPRKLAGTSSEFAVRGAASDPTQQAGLRAFCLHPPAGAPSSVAMQGAMEIRPLEQAAAPPECATSDLLKLTYSNRAGYQELFLFGLDEKLDLKWYAPRPPSEVSVPARAGAVDSPIGGAIKLGVNHDPGMVRLYALFGHAPIDAREVEAAVDELKRRRTSLHDAAELPLDGRRDVLVRSLLIELTGPAK
jgi:hypothetical protein